MGVELYHSTYCPGLSKTFQSGCVLCFERSGGHRRTFTGETRNLKHAEGIRLQQKQKERELKREQALRDRFPDLDDTFYFIAGYTSGGAPLWRNMRRNGSEAL